MQACMWKLSLIQCAQIEKSLDDFKKVTRYFSFIKDHIGFSRKWLLGDSVKAGRPVKRP